MKSSAPLCLALISGVDRIRLVSTVVAQTRIGALEVVPNVPMGLDLATLRVEQSYSMKRISKIWGKEKYHCWCLCNLQ